LHETAGQNEYGEEYYGEEEEEEEEDTAHQSQV